jgi:ribosomal protein S18 acetylase RimI-like enzyme
LGGGLSGVSDDLRIEEASEADDEVVRAISHLIAQLSRSAAPATAAEVREIVRAPASRLLIARDSSGTAVGMLTLVLFRIPTGIRARIEDVVVDEQARGMGLGEALTAAALRLARQAGARTVDLTSRPSREAANRLYLKMGFRPRDSTVYRFEIADE